MVQKYQMEGEFLQVSAIANLAANDGVFELIKSDNNTKGISMLNDYMNRDPYDGANFGAFITFQPQLGIIRANCEEVREFGLFCLLKLCQLGEKASMIKSRIWRDVSINGGIDLLIQIANSKPSKPQRYASEVLELLEIPVAMISTPKHPHYVDILEKRIFSDVTFIVDGNCIYAHKVILAANSPYFNAMFTINLREQTASVVEISEFSFQVFETLIRFLYTPIPPTFTTQSALEIIVCADMYFVLDLKLFAEHFLCQFVDSSNFEELLQFAKKYECQRLVEICQKNKI